MNNEILVWPIDWRRNGRGLTTEIGHMTWGRLKAAVDGLPDGCEPFELLAVDKQPTAGGYVDHVHPVDLLGVDERAAAGSWNYFLWSRTLTPGLDLWLSSSPPNGQLAPILALNGLINLQYRRRLKGQELPTRIGCVNRIVSTRGEELQHRQYERAYRTLTRRLARTESSDHDS